MSDFRSDAERFVTDFLDYVQTYDIRDALNRQTQKMERSPGVEALVKQAQAVFPPRADDGQKENDKLTPEQKEEAIRGNPNVVVDTREMFARRVARNGGTRKLLRDLFEGDEGARERVAEFFAAEDGEKEFAKE